MADASPLRFALAGMIGMAAALGIGRFMYTPILPGMMAALGLTPAAAGLIASANYLGYLVGALAAAGGWAESRERPLMLGALGANALLAAAMALTDSVALFVAIRLLAGAASAFVMVFLASIVFRPLAIADRNDLQALHFGGVGVGIALSSIAMLALAAAQPSWRAGWLAAAALSAFGFVAVACLAGRGAPVGARRGAEPSLPRSWPLMRMILAYGLFGLGYVVTATFLIAIVRQGAGGPSFEAVVWLATGLAAAPSVLLWRRFARLTGLARAYAVACLVEAAGVAAGVAIPGKAGPLAAALLLGGSFVAITALGLELGRKLAPQAPRRVFALMTASFGLGQIVGPILAGHAAGITGSFYIPSLAAALALLASGLVAWSAGVPK